MTPMATPPTDETRALFKLLRDGEWHSYAEIRDRLADKVAPGKALRQYQHRLLKNRGFRKDENKNIEYTETEQIYWGARAVAQTTISSWKGRGGLAWRGEGDSKEIKLKPGMKAWGMLVETDKPNGEAQDPSSEVEGYTDPPPADSEPSAAQGAAPEVVAERAADEMPGPSDPPPVAAETGREVEQMTTVSHDLAALEVVDKASSQTVSFSDLTTCPECSMAVVDQEAHSRWHEDQKGLLAARESDSVDNVIPLTEVSKLLDTFQEGMQTYLESRFAEVERLIERSILATRVAQAGSQKWAKGKPWHAQS